MNDLTRFETLAVQMAAVVPLIRDLQDILGEETIAAALSERLQRQQANTPTGTNPDFSRMVEGTAYFAAGGALEYEVIASDRQTFDMDVHDCRYADMMEQLGGRDLGHLLICGNDFAAARKIGMTLDRSQTRMQGASHCDFRYRPIAASER
ncbi:MAG: L-2-amino-thiazoline-4-carboxylic acid hydrolase [Pseudomonadales bacterium]